MQGDAADNRGVGTDARAPLHKRFLIIITRVARKFAARREHIGKNHAGTAKNIVFQHDALIHGDVVLNFDTVADYDVVGHQYILSQRAVLPYHRTGHHVAEVPDFSAFTNLSAFVDVGGFVGKILRHHAPRPAAFGLARVPSPLLDHCGHQTEVADP